MKIKIKCFLKNRLPQSSQQAHKPDSQFFAELIAEVTFKGC